MPNFLFRLISACGAVGSIGLGLYMPAQALADEVEIGGAAVVPVIAKNSNNIDTAAANLFGGKAISSEALDIFRGGTEVQTLDISKNDGVVRDNQAYNLTTGNNVITDGSLAGASGFSTVVQNSGNNVLIQNSTIINLQVK